MKKLMSRKLIAFILTICMVWTSVPELAMAGETGNTPAGGETQQKEDGELEQSDVTKDDIIKSENTESSTTYNLGGEKELTVVYGQDIRYKDENGTLIDYDPSLVDIKGSKTENKNDLDGYSYENKAGDKKQYIPEEISPGTPILLENEGHEISLSPAAETLKDTGTDKQEVDIQKEKTLTAEDENKLLPTKAVYESQDKKTVFEYVSSDIGIKENLILNEIPKDNEFKYELNMKGLNVRKNSLNNGLTFYDKKTEEIAGFIAPPFMNDASKKAYSEDLEYSLAKKENTQDTYILTLTIDEEYLKDKDRQYPVTVDPTVTWTGSSKAYDVYVISKSPYKGTNFYDSGITTMAAGNGKQGVFRTYMNFAGLKSSVLQRYVSSAKLTLYETGAGASNETIGAHRVTGSWSRGSLTWNNRPGYSGTAYGTVKTTSTRHKARTLNVTNYARYLAKDGNAYGVMIKNQNESSDYTEFYSSRYATSKYRPKLTVVHYAPPTQASSVSATPAYIKKGSATTIKWAGIKSVALDKIEYRVAKYDPVKKEFIDENFVSYATGSSLGKTASGSKVFNSAKTWPAGCYKIYLRGVDASGVKASGKACTLYIDGTAPTLASASISPVSTQPAPSAVKTPVISWSGAADTYLKEIQYSVDDGSFVKLGTGASGSFTVPAGTFEKSGNHAIKVRAVDKAGNVSAQKSLSYYVDVTPPEFGDVNIKTSDKDSLGDSWTKDTDPTIEFTGVTEKNSGIAASGISYAVSGSDRAPAAADFKTPENVTVSGSGDVYSGLFKLKAADKVSESGVSYIHVKIKDGSENEAVKSAVYKKDFTKPEGTIKTRYLSEDVTALEGTVDIIGEISDKQSGIKESSMKLYRLTEVSGQSEPQEEFAANIYSNATISKTKAFDTKEYANGNYRLKLTVKDELDNEKVVSKDVTIANRISAPIAIAAPKAASPAEICWTYFPAIGNLAKTQYKLTGGEWTDIANSAAATGSFNAAVPNEDGTYKVAVRGVDTDGLAGKETEAVCIIDKQDPEVGITSFENGLVTGTAKDARLADWKIYIKKKSDPAGSYEQVLTGTANIDGGQFGIVDISGSGYPANTDYTLKLEASDTVGNSSSETFDIHKGADYVNAQIIAPAFRISRPNDQSYEPRGFVLPTDTGSLSLTAQDEGTIPAGTRTWFIDGDKKGTGETFADDFTGKEPQGGGAAKYEEGRAYAATAVIKGSNAEPLYSSNTIKNRKNLAVSWTNAQVSGEVLTKEVTLPFKTSSFRLIGQEESSSGNDVTYAVKIGNGDYENVTPETTYYVSELTEQKIATEEITIKASLTSAGEISNLNACSLQLDSLDEDSFKISEAEKYRPENLSVRDKINYKTYIKWDIPEDLPSDITYEVYRGKSENFEPSADTLATSGIRDGYFVELNTNYSENFYYKVRAVKKAGESSEQKSSFSEEVPASVVDADEYTKRMGIKEYWEYAEAETPSGNISIEKSKGNMVYAQTDAELANEQLPVDIKRVYNSQSSAKSAFGTGWNHSFDIELLNICKNDSLEHKQIAYKDENGTIFLFTKGSDGKYISSAGKYIKLEEEEKTQGVQLPSSGIGTGEDRTVIVKSAFTVTTKDNLEYRFDRSGQLVYMAEANGNFLLFDYDQKEGLLTKVTTSKNLQIGFEYNDGTNGTDPQTIKKITLPDSSYIGYNYDTDGNLTSAVKHGAGGSGAITYSFDYASGGSNMPANLDEVTDGKGNEYGISYDSADRADEITYPNSEKISLQYGNDTAVTKKMLSGSELTSTTDEFDPTSGNCIKTIDPAGNETVRTYTDDLLASTANTVSRQKLENGIVKTYESQKRTDTAYTEDENVSSETDDEGTTTEYTYYGESAGKYKAGKVQTEKEINGKGETVSSIGYDYDPLGNETSSEDSITGEKTETIYYEHDNVSRGEVKSEKESLKGSETSDIKYQYSYKPNGNKVETMIEEEDGFTKTTVTEYDVMGRVIAESESTGNDLIKEEANTYDGFGRLIRNEKTEGNITTITQSTYDANGTLVQEAVSGGNTTTYTYDNMNRVTSTVVSKGSESYTENTAYSYENATINSGKGCEIVNNAFITTKTDESGNVLSKTYQDAMGRTVREKQNGLFTDYTYDKSGNLITTYAIGANEHNPASDGLVTLSLFDENGRQTNTIIKPEVDTATGAFKATDNSIVTSSVYDSAGNKISETDPLGNATTYTYDVQARETNITLPGGSSTSVAYDNILEDGKGNKTEITDANGSKSYTITSAGGNEIETADAGKGDGSVTKIKKTSTFDARSNKIREEDSEGNYRTFEYDGKGRTSAVHYFDSEQNETLKTEYTYDSTDNVLTMKDSKAADSGMTMYRYTKYTYDFMGRKTSAAEWDGSTMPTESQLSDKTITYEYDLKNNLTEISYPNTGRSVQGLTFEYNSDNWLTDINAVTASGEEDIRDYTYTEDGKVATIKNYRDFLDSGSDYVLCSYTYDDLDRTTKMEYKDSSDMSAVKEAYRLTYDKNSRITTEKIVNDYPAEDEDKINEERTYTYDSCGRLTQMEREDLETNDTVVKAYEYDSVGNRTKETDDQDVTDYTYNSLNQLIAEKTSDGEEQIANKTYIYDKNGNQTSETDSINSTLKECTYDADNRLSSYTSKKDDDILFRQYTEYNGLGQRISKVEGDKNTKYFYQDGKVLYTESDEIVDNEEIDESEEPQTQTKITSLNLLNLDRRPIATARSEGTGEDYYFYNKDVRGSTTNIIDDTGASKICYTYDDFGETTAHGDTDFYNEICYTGGVYDDSTELYYLNARYYDPENGRFTTQDTYRGETTDPNTWHLYAYCMNNPINFVDPSGHKVKYFRKTFRELMRVVEAGLVVVNVTVFDNENYKDSKKYRKFTSRCYGALFESYNYWEALDKLSCSIGPVRHHNPKQIICNSKPCKHDHIHSGHTFAYKYRDSTTDVKHKKGSKKSRIKLGYVIGGAVVWPHHKNAVFKNITN